VRSQIDVSERRGECIPGALSFSRTSSDAGFPWIEISSASSELHVRDDQPDAFALLIGRQGLVQRPELSERRQHALLVHGVPLDLLDRPLDLGDRGLEAGAPLPELGR